MPHDGPIEDGEISVEGVVDLLNEGDADETNLLEGKDEKGKEGDSSEKRAQYDKEEDEDEDEEGKEDDEEEDEDDDEEVRGDKDDDERELELITPYRKQEILKAYPGIDKKFPYIFQAYYGYQKFTDLFPSIEDAEGAVEKSKALDRVYGEIMSGNTTNILNEIKRNPKAFYKMVDDYIPALAKVDKDAATHVVAGVYKNAIVTMINFARENQNEELEKAAGILHQFLFSTNKFTPHQRLSKDSVEDSDEQQRIAEERRQFNEERFNTVQQDIIEKMDNAVMSTIKVNIDPKKQMTPYVRNKAAQDAFNLLEKNLLADRMFKSQLDRLWKASFEDNLSRSSLERIRKAFLSRATTLLPGVLKHARNEALKGLGRKTSSDDADRRGHLPVGRNSSSVTSSGGERKRGEIPKNMSVRDFIMSD